MSTTYANPDGSWTVDKSFGPVRVRRGARWVAVDADLARTPSGTYATRATTATVEVSSGGRVPLVQVYDGRRRLTLSWPTPLPAPTVDGSVATYAEVLPGVDLKVRATDAGFGHDVVVKTEEAAANPALARIRLALSATGLKVSTDSAGNLSAVDSAGTEVFHAPAPLMWDDAKPRVERSVGVEVSEDAMTLVPDVAMLRDPKTRFPVTIDPTYSHYTPGAQNKWTLVRRSHPTASHWNLQPRDQDERNLGVARVGHAPGWPAEYLDRSLFAFDTQRLAGSTIQSATFRIWQVWKYSNSCDPAAVDALQLWHTSGIASNTTWNNQPPWYTHLSSANSVPKAGSCDPNWVGLDAKSAVQTAATNGSPNLVLGLRAASEGNDTGWKRFYVQSGTYPMLSITYNRKPAAPTAVDTEPKLAACTWCGGTPYVGATRLNLKGAITDPDGGQVTGRWNIRKPGLETRSQTLASGSKFATPLDTTGIANGTTVTWDLTGTDGALTGPTVTGPKFVIDKTAPATEPAVNGVIYKPDNQWHGGVNVADTFTFGPGAETDIDHYLWGWQSPPSNKVPATGGLNGTAKVAISPEGDGPRTLYVQSVDRAGNRSLRTKEYRIYVRSGNGPYTQYSFEGNAQDTAYLGDNHGTLNGTAAFGAGAVGTAVHFDGHHGSDMTAPRAVATNGSFSVMAWVKLTNADYARAAVSQDGANFPGYALWYRPDTGKWAFGMANSDSTYAGTDQVLSTEPAQVNTWTHLAGVYDVSTKKLTLYVNGQKTGPTQTLRTVTSWDATGPLRIGRVKWQGALADPWAGSVDEVRVYDRAVTSTEVSAAVSGTNVQVAQWPFDEALNSTTPGQTAANTVTGGDAAILFADGAEFGRDNEGERGWVELDGTTGFVTTNRATLRTDQSFSVAATVSAHDFTRDFTVVCQHGSKVSGFCLEYDHDVDRWAFTLPHNDSATPSGRDSVSSDQAPAKPLADAVSQVQPTHLTGTFDTTTGRARLFVNGVEQKAPAGTAPGVPHTSLWHATGPLEIGRGLVAGTPANHLDGTVDEVRLYSRAISPEEIQGLVSQSDITAGTWTFDGDARDSSARGLHGQLHGGPSWTAGQTTAPDPGDLAVRLDGVDDHVSARKAVATNQSFSVTGWVRLDRAGQQGAVVSQDASAVNAFSLRVNATGRWTFAMPRSDSATAVVDEVVDSAAQVGVWTHLAAVYSRERGQIELYVNGVLAGTVAHTNTFDTGGGLRIGGGTKNGSVVDLFPGAVDDLSVYNRPLLLTEIRTMSGRDLSLAHHWTLDEGSGTSAADSTGARPAVSTGGVTREAGRVSNSVRTNGVDGALSTTGIDVRNDQSFTVAAWVNLDNYACDYRCTVDAVSVDGPQSSKFRLGHRVDMDQNPLGSWVFEMPSSDGTSYEAAVSFDPADVGQWVHLVGVYDAPSRTLWLYVNGNRIDNGTLLSPWQATGGVLIGRGKVNGAAAEFWPGGIDDVRMYSGALDRARIGALYRSFPAAAAPGASPDPDAGHWAFDEGTGTTAVDAGSQGLDATLVGSTSWSGDGRIKSAASFDGTTGYAKTVGRALDTGASFSSAAWVRLSGSGSQDRVVLGQDGTQLSAFQLKYESASGKWAIQVPSADATNSTKTVVRSTEPATGEWTHLALVYDKNVRQVRLYVNGVPSATEPGVVVPPSTGSFVIGRGKTNGADADFFSGSVDDVRLFTTALEDGQVRSVHDDAPWFGLGMWRFNESNTDDYHWRQVDATRSTSGTSFGPGINGLGLQLDGTAGAATTPTRAVTMWDSFTVSAWTRLTQGDKIATVLSQDGARTSGFALQYRPESGRWLFGASSQDADGAPLVGALSSQPAVLNQWVHLAGVYDHSAQQVRLYVNGQLAGTRNQNPMWPATGAFTIGRGKLNGAAAHFLPGAVDEVRVDQGMVSDAEIAVRAGWPAPAPQALGSFVNAAGDRYTAMTDSTIPPGYHYESALGLAVADQPDTHLLYGCISGTDRFTSADPACAGETVTGEVARVYSAPSADNPTIPIYSCRLGADRHESRHQSCAGGVNEGVLGYSIAFAPLVRYNSRSGADHWTSIDGTAPSYYQEGWYGWVAIAPQPGTQPVMSCRNDIDEFTSLELSCEGEQVIDGTGYVYTTPPAELESIPLYRCLHQTDRFVSASATCEGQTLDRPLGHALDTLPIHTPVDDAVTALTPDLPRF
ncbi:LamG-like jellyroll fold domain-containing protein [Actinophytocola xanthii]|nr:LamG-like jellyroll fold domain-containing protein [Actinophytocola xanthii]